MMEKEENYIILDVHTEPEYTARRTPQEFREGCVPGRKNLPLQRIPEAQNTANQNDFSVCLLLLRLAQLMDYTNVTNSGTLPLIQER